MINSTNHDLFYLWEVVSLMNLKHTIPWYQEVKIFEQVPGIKEPRLFYEGRADKMSLHRKNYRVLKIEIVGRFFIVLVEEIIKSRGLFYISAARAKESEEFEKKLYKECLRDAIGEE